MPHEELSTARTTTTVTPMTAATATVDVDRVRLDRALRGMSYDDARRATSPLEIERQRRLEAIAARMRETLRTSPGAERFTQQTAFFLDILPDGVIAHLVTGVPTSITLAQAAQETGYGGTPTRGNNFFGIKGQGPAGSTTENTTEFENGREVQTTDEFRAYDNRFDSFIDHGRLISEDPNYAGAMAAKDDPDRMADELQSAGYATDPDYASSLKWIMSTFALAAIDPMVGELAQVSTGMGATTTGPTSTSTTPETAPQDDLTKESLRQTLAAQTGTPVDEIAKQDLSRHPTRAEAVKMVVSAFKLLAPAGLRVRPFLDVPTSAWFAPFVATARALGVVQGYGDNRFQPTTPVTQAHLGLIIEHAANPTGAPPDALVTSTTDRGELAAKSARLEYQRGRELHGDGVWETTGSNDGPLVDEYKQSNHAGANEDLEWCGMFVGHNYKKAGIREEILKNNVFWSGYRLSKFFADGGYVATALPRAGDWWQAHTYVELGAQTGDTRKAALDAFGPRPGDVILFGAGYTHVGILSSYNAETGDIELVEGNTGNRVKATVEGTQSSQIRFLGRFNESDYDPNGSPDAGVQDAAEPGTTFEPR